MCVSGVRNETACFRVSPSPDIQPRKTKNRRLSLAATHIDMHLLRATEITTEVLTESLCFQMNVDLLIRKDQGC